MGNNGLNYYVRHLGDYIKDTAHLTILEHGAYNRLLDRYYATEKPIPQKEAYRVARTSNKQERDAVDSVLQEYFKLIGGLWTNKRCDQEIAKFREGDADREAKKANEKERKRRSREHRKQQFDVLREMGIVPRWDTPMSELVRLIDGAVTRTGGGQVADGDGDGTATHSPFSIPINQEKNSETKNGLSRNRKPELDRLVAETAQGRKIKESA